MDSRIIRAAAARVKARCSAGRLPARRRTRSKAIGRRDLPPDVEMPRVEKL